MTPLILLRVALAAAFLAGCTSAPGEAIVPHGRLASRPQKTADACAPGERRLVLSSGPDAHLYIPAAAASRTSVPLLVFLHGAGGSADQTIEYMRPIADEYGFVLLVPGSVGRTWDGIREKPEVDAARIDEALRVAFESCPVDRRRLAIGGFSDGASYALTIGLGNGDLFSHVIAFAPCGVSRDVKLIEGPRVFVSHGAQDDVLPIERCGRPIVAALKRKGYEVRFVEFQGKHEIPANVAAAAFAWFTK